MEHKYVIGYLILAHQNPQQLARLISTLDNDEVVFWVHIDKGSSVEDFKRMAPSNNRIFFLKQRMKIFWMGYSMVNATLLLIKAALRSPLACRYYVLLSGTDYPIKGNRYILDFYKNATTQFINTFGLEDALWSHKISKYHYFDTNIFNPRGWLNEKIPFLHRFAMRLYRLVQGKLPGRRFPFTMEPYGGGQFWSLTAECVSYIDRYMEANKAVARFYKFTHSPDEMVFPTIIMNSGYGVELKKCAEDRFWYHEQKFVTGFGTCLRYIDWHPARELPAILKDEDFEKLLSSEDHFARKFCPSRSRGLMEKIDQYLD